MYCPLKIFKHLVCALDFYHYADAIIQYEAGETSTDGLAINKRTKTDTLHNALNDDTSSLKQKF